MSNRKAKKIKSHRLYSKKKWHTKEEQKYMWKDQKGKFVEVLDVTFITTVMSFSCLVLICHFVFLKNIDISFFLKIFIDPL